MHYEKGAGKKGDERVRADVNFCSSRILFVSFAKEPYKKGIILQKRADVKFAILIYNQIQIRNIDI